MAKTSRREHLIDTSINLFYERGFHATGIDLILETAGVSKKTMYLYFRSKEELIYAALQKFDSTFRNQFMRAVEESSNTPEGKLLGIFDVAEHWFNENNFFGCMFINAVGEYSERESPVRDLSKQFKQQMRVYVSNIIKDGGFKQESDFADQICLLLEGAIVTAQVSQDASSARTARNIVENLIEKNKLA